MCGRRALTVKGVQVDSEAAGLAVASATLPADVGPVSGVSPDVTRELNGLSKNSLAVLTHVHLP